MIIDSSGKDCKVWKSELIGPAVIVDTGSGPHVGSFRVDGTASKQTNYMKICFIQKPNNTIRVLIGLCKFGVHGCIVLYRISWYTESYYKGFLLYVLCDGVVPTCPWETEPSLVSVVWWSGAYLFLGDWTIPGICCVMEWCLPVPGRAGHVPWRAPHTAASTCLPRHSTFAQSDKTMTEASHNGNNV